MEARRGRLRARARGRRAPLQPSPDSIEHDMSPSLILIQLLSGLAHAMVLFLIASGLSLIFGVTRIVNFAHGSFYMLAAYLTYTLTATLPLGVAAFYVAVPLAAAPVGLAVLGVDQARLFTSVFALGSFLAGLGGALQVPRQALTNVMDTSIITEAFVVVVVGGMGSVPGALLAAVVIGVIDAFGVLVLPRASLVMMFVVMAVILIVRPWGLLGRPPTQPRTAGGAIVTASALRVPRPWVAAVAALLIVVPPVLPTFHVWVLVEILAFALFAASLHLLMGTGGMVSFGPAASFGP